MFSVSLVSAHMTNLRSNIFEDPIWVASDRVNEPFHLDLLLLVEVFDAGGCEKLVDESTKTSVFLSIGSEER